MFKMHSRSTVEKRIKDIKRKTRRRFNTEEKIRIVLEGIKGETSIAEHEGSRKSISIDIIDYSHSFRSDSSRL